MPAPPLSQRRTRYEAGAALRLIADQSGATAIEYTLIMVLIVMSLVVLIEQIGDFVSVPFLTIAAQL